ncbi:MAG: arylsulfatase [Verrucomicrobiaceae bacterium]|nr:arylsulfatase [Verrucomicrobiaceae bacterium]
MQRIVTTLLLLAFSAAHSAQPNIIFILCDDLAQGDLGCYGQKTIQTPHLDRMAHEGTRFTQAFCGTSVCAPSRASLMTGLHSGHCPIRANREIQPEGQKPLPEGTVTVASVLKNAGYATACIGKWGMGMFDTPGSPLKRGFDHFFGYNCQRHAHSYFPTYLYDDDRRIELPGNDGKSIGKTYAQNLISDEAVRWVAHQHEKPFFLFYAMTLPHGRHEIDELGIYENKDGWSPTQKAYAAQVTRLDADVGRLLDLLKKNGISDNTLVIISGDNGSSFDPKSEVGSLFNQASNGLRGFKRSLYEGALRQAAIAWWPGTIPAGRVVDDPWAFWDFLPTAAELAGTKTAAEVKLDGLSLVDMLKGGKAPVRPYFYWELHEGASQQAARFGQWKAIRNSPSEPIELYDLSQDQAETNNLANTNPDIIARAESIFREARTEHPDWPLVSTRQLKKKKSKK